MQGYFGAFQHQDTPKLIKFPQKSIILSLLQGEMVYQAVDIINVVHNSAFRIYQRRIPDYRKFSAYKHFA